MVSKWISIEGPSQVDALKKAAQHARIQPVLTMICQTKTKASFWGGSVLLLHLLYIDRLIFYLNEPDPYKIHTNAICITILPRKHKDSSWGFNSVRFCFSLHSLVAMPETEAGGGDARAHRG